MDKRTDLNELYDFLNQYSWYVVEVMYGGFYTCFENTGYEPIKQGIAFDDLTVSTIAWFDISPNSDNVYIHLSDNNCINIICMGFISMTKKLYEVMSQYYSFIIDIHNDTFAFIVGVHGNIQLKNDEIIGENLTIKNVESFSIYEDCENPDIMNIDISFTDSATMTISCL
jgi:hypothetical protein